MNLNSKLNNNILNPSKKTIKNQRKLNREDNLNMLKHQLKMKNNNKNLNKLTLRKNNLKVK